MPQQTPTLSLVPPPAACRDHGTIRSIESARRRRSRRPASVDGPASPYAIRVLVVGGHALSRAGLRRLLEDDGQFTVIGEAASGHEGAELIGSTEPDVVLLDADTWESDLAACTRVLGGRVAVLLLTETDADDRLFAALRAGATGVLPKDSHPVELASAVRTLAGGGALVPPRTTRRLITELAKTMSTTF
jgi:DNA-binding NarL/FixJ family response regulator